MLNYSETWINELWGSGRASLLCFTRRCHQAPTSASACLWRAHTGEVCGEAEKSNQLHSPVSSLTLGMMSSKVPNTFPGPICQHRTCYTLSPNYPVSFSCRSSFSYEFYYYLTTPKTSPFPMLKQQLSSPSHLSLALPMSPPYSGPSPCQCLDLTWGRLSPLPCTVKCSFYPACSWEGSQPWE